jgi:uncharacterized membrane protein YciS (DUF1049 family)
MLKAVIKTFALLVILFVMLYVGMNNTRPIDFNFPIPGVKAREPVRASAALIYFGVFAVGLLAGTVLSLGGGGRGGKRGAAPRDK